MIVNGKEYNVNELMKDVDTKSNHLNKIGTFYLTNKEIEILDRNFIDYQICTSLNDLMFKIQNILDDEALDPDDGDELDYVLENISERNYYQNVNK